jgi:hypothetical protein
MILWQIDMSLRLLRSRPDLVQTATLHGVPGKQKVYQLVF